MLALILFIALQFRFVWDFLKEYEEIPTKELFIEWFFKTLMAGFGCSLFHILFNLM